MSGIFVQMTGMSGAGKSTMTFLAQTRLREMGYNVEVIDGDEYREGLCKDLGFSKEDRNTNIRRLSFVGKVLSRNNVVCVMSAINPYDDVRREVQMNNPLSKIVYVKCEIDTLVDRDPKGLYKKARSGALKNFTGIDSPYETPLNPELHLKTENKKVSELVTQILSYLEGKI